MGKMPEQGSVSRRRVSRQGLWGVGVLLLVAGLAGCSASRPEQARIWKTYENPRYRFEFPYPDTWVAAPLVANQDGQSFSDPNDPNVKILGWASKVSAETALQQPDSVKSPMNLNFVTDQGMQGNLRVEVGMENSVMTLTLTQGEVIYGWQGRSPSDQFPRYYQFFDYVARQYQLPPVMQAK